MEIVYSVLVDMLCRVYAMKKELLQTQNYSIQLGDTGGKKLHILVH